MKFSIRQGLVLLGLSMFASPAFTQIVWSENFTYPNGTTTGGNNNLSNPALDWTSSCATCVAGDWYEVRSGVMEGRDTNGPAELTTESIDISSLAFGAMVTMDLTESGTMEGCPGGISTGCTSIDWIQIEYKLDNNPWVDVGSPLGGPCLGACAGATYYTIDDFTSTIATVCPLMGDSLRLRISVQTWAAEEFLRVDNIVVQGQTCVPIFASDSTVDVVCPGDNDGEIWIDADGPFPPFTYSLNGGPFQSANNFTGLSGGTYTVIIRDNNGNQDTLTGIVVNEPAAFTLGHSVVNVSCNGGSDGQIQALGVSGGTPSYQFALNAPPFQSSPTFTGLGAGNYNLILEDAVGCRDTVPAVVNEPPPLTFGVTVTPVTCNGAGDGQIQAVGISGGTPLYEFSLNNAPFQLSGTFSGLAPGNYVLILEDGNGCRDTVSTVVNEPLPITYGIVATAVTCNGGSDGQIQLQSVSGGTPPYQFALNGGTFQSSNVFSGLGAGSYTVMVQDTNGCQDTFTVAVNQPAAIVLSLSSTPSSCSAPTGTATVTASGGAGGYIYAWGTTPPQSNDTATGLWPGAYTIAVSDVNGCFVVDTVVVQSPTMPAVNAGLPDSICAGQGAAQLTATGSGTAGPFTYAWWCDSTSTPCNLDSLADDDPLASPTTTTTYYVQVTDTAGCLSLVDSVTVTVLALPVGDAGADTSFCAGGGVQLQGSASGVMAPFAFNWTCNTLPTPCNIDSVADDAPYVQPTATTTYYLQLTDAYGCTGVMDSTVVTVVPIPVPDAGMGDTICPGDTAQLAGTGSGGTIPYAFDWMPGTTLSDSTVANPWAFPLASTWYYLNVSSQGCTSPLDSVWIEVNAVPLALAGADTIVCQGDRVTWIAGVTGGGTGYTFEWYGPGGLLNPTGNDTLSIVPDQTTAYTLIVRAPAGCPSLPDTVWATVETPFVHPVPEDLEFCPGEPLTIGTEPEAGFTYLWSPIEGLQEFNVSQTQVIATEAGAYTLHVTDETKISVNCRTQDFQVNLIDGGCMFPNVFTPNGDGINDVLDLGHYYHGAQLVVYDRWGKAVYQNDSYQNDWNGTSTLGVKVPDGVYYYTVRTRWMGTGRPLPQGNPNAQAYQLTLLR